MKSRAVVTIERNRDITQRELLRGVSDLLRLLKEDELAMQTLGVRKELRNSIEQKFWIQDRSYYAIALDGEKQPLQVDSSNPGHLLFCGAMSEEGARQVSERLLNKGLFSGWGIRTLSCSEAYFNPRSYHCGSVWPHDNSIIGYGMSLYGFHREASIIFQALYEAALHFRDYRLPELFCGIPRQIRSEPVHYPISCSPQAWASRKVLKRIAETHQAIPRQVALRFLLRLPGLFAIPKASTPEHGEEMPVQEISR